MNNHPYQGGHGANAPPSALPLHPQRRDFVPYAQQHVAQHTGIVQPYPTYHPAASFYHTQPPRWQPNYQQAYPQHFMQPQQWMPPQHFAQRSPMIVSSQPHGQPVTRQQHPIPSIPQSTQSPRPVPQYIHHQPPAASPSPAPAQVPTPVPVPAPVPAIAPKPEERLETPPPPESRRQSIAQSPLSLDPEYRDQFWPPGGVSSFSILFSDIR